MINNDEAIIIKVVTAGDLSEARVASVAKKFAESHDISDYKVETEADSSLISGFVIYALGSRFDYSAKGQLAKINESIRRKREESDSSENFSADELRATIEGALKEFNFAPTLKATREDMNSAAGIEDIENGEEVGTVLTLGDGVAMVDGLEHCMASELVVFENGSYGIAMNLETDKIGVVVLTDIYGVREGMICRRTGKTVSVPVGDNLLGRVVDPLGHPIDGKGSIRYTETRPIESPAPTIVERSPVNRPLATGITAIDALTPIGRGQRELIIGDRQTGKTAIAIDTIINQRGKDVICIYVAIGQKMSTIVNTVHLLEKYDALRYTIIVAAGASDSASLQYIAPYSGCAMAEKFMYDEHKDVLIVYDDLSKHAQAYRAISLLLRRPPGREAYPGDVFYLHSRLLERAAKLSPELGGGSITALPIIETLGGDISAYIPTNVISITDGQIYLESELFFAGQRPAINVGLSVSRVGGAAQTKATKKVGGPLRISLAQARELASFAQFGSDLDENTQLQLRRGKVLNEVLKQEQFRPLSMEDQVIILYMATTDRMNFLAKEDIKDYYESFIDRVDSIDMSIRETIRRTEQFTDEVSGKLDAALDRFNADFIIEHPEYKV